MHKHQARNIPSTKDPISRVEKSEVPVYQLSSAQFASINQVKPQTVHARVCRTGSYFGVVPLKLASGRLAFPNIQVKASDEKNRH